LSPRPFDIIPEDIPGVLSYLNTMVVKMDEIQKDHEIDTGELKADFKEFKDEMRAELNVVKGMVTSFQNKVFGVLITIVVAIAGRYGLDLSGVLQ
jgi:uncharacterized protein YabN with tetrapyrrole methylase and pyrophosphatase domain